MCYANPCPSRGEEGVLPEPFIWMLFEGLAQTALDLQNGRGLPTPYGPWTGEIVHQEIKPDNSEHTALPSCTIDLGADVV